MNSSAHGSHALADKIRTTNNIDKYLDEEKSSGNNYNDLKKKIQSDIWETNDLAEEIDLVLSINASSPIKTIVEAPNEAGDSINTPGNRMSQKLEKKYSVFSLSSVGSSHSLQTGQEDHSQRRASSTAHAYRNSTNSIDNDYQRKFNVRFVFAFYT